MKEIKNTSLALLQLADSNEATDNFLRLLCGVVFAGFAVAIINQSYGSNSPFKN